MKVSQNSCNNNTLNKINKLHYGAFILWLIATVISASYFINKKLVNFDPEQKLSVEHKSIIAEINKLHQLKSHSLAKTIVHFTQASCHCTSYSEEHKALINVQAKKDNFTVLNIELAESYQGIIPSTPAILITDKQGELLYFGPYSEGLACSQTNGFVELVLANYAKGYQANLVVNDSEGCYCNS